MTTESAGAVDLDPPMSADEIGYVRRLASDADPRMMAWLPARDGTCLRPRPGAEVESCMESLRYLVATMERPGRFSGMVAIFDTGTRELVGITVANGRVTRRVLRKARPPRATGPGSNVIELSSRRRTTNRAIS